MVAQAQAVLTDAELQLSRGEELVRNRNIPSRRWMRAVPAVTTPRER